MKDLFDKVLFAVLVTLISTYVLYSYNIYSKSFETAQAQSHPYSTLANKLYGRIADDLTDLTRDVEMERLKASPQLTDKSRQEMLRYAHDIRVRSSALAPTL